MKMRGSVVRDGVEVWAGDVDTSLSLRSVPEIADAVWSVGPYPDGCLFFGGTMAVPPPEFSLTEGDRLLSKCSTYSLTLDVPARRIVPEKRAPRGELLEWPEAAAVS